MHLSEEMEIKYHRAKVKLEEILPFFAYLSSFFDPTETNTTPVASINAKGKLRLNPRTFLRLNVEGAAWVLAHETMHMVIATAARFPEGGNHMMWNVASDILINQIITDDTGLAIPPSSVIGDICYGKFTLNDGRTIDCTKYVDWTTHAAYNDLMQEFGKEADKEEKQKEEGKGDEEGQDMGGSGDGDEPSQQKGLFKGKWWCDSGVGAGQSAGDGDSEGTEEGSGECCGSMEMTDDQAQEWLDRIASAHMKAAGKMPGALGDYITELLKPKKNWRRELMRCTCSTIRNLYTWRRPGRRTSGIIRTPGMEPGLPEVGVYCDTSGSMSDTVLQRCLSEGSSIAKVAGGELRLLLGDAIIYHDGQATPKAFAALPVQRGGTSFVALFDHIEKSKKPAPKMLIAFSDCCGPFPAHPPKFPVVWCIPKDGGSDRPPWGRVIEIEVDGYE